MDFHLIHKEKLRVILTAEDMTSMGLAYETMNLADTATRAALLLLIGDAGREVGFRPNGAKLFIEVYSRAEDGCVLYFTLLTGGRRERAGTKPALFRFDDIETAIRAAAGVRGRCGHRIFESSLYRVDGGYRLAILPLDYAGRLCVSLLGEFGEPIEAGELAIAHAREHGEELIRGNAIEVLAGLS